MNNEPVAWAYIKDGEFWDAIHPDEHAQEEGSYTIPLYTHPHPDNLGLAESIIKQQQAEIEALKQIIDANNLNQNIGQFVKPTNKPVAWMDYLEHSDVYDLNVSGRGIPLYTHPVKEEHFEDEPQAEELHEIMQSNTHPVKEQYKFGVDWSKDGNAVTVLKICEDGVAEVVFMDYQEVTHPVKELTLTNEEMISIYEKDWSGIKCGLGRAVEQAILLKAQE